MQATTSYSIDPDHSSTSAARLGSFRQITTGATPPRNRNTFCQRNSRMASLELISAGLRPRHHGGSRNSTEMHDSSPRIKKLPISTSYQRTTPPLRHTLRTVLRFRPSRSNLSLSSSPLTRCTAWTSASRCTNIAAILSPPTHANASRNTFTERICFATSSCIATASPGRVR